GVVLGRPQQLHPHIGAGEIIDRHVPRLEQEVRGGAVGDRLAGELHPDPPRRGLERDPVAGVLGKARGAGHAGGKNTTIRTSMLSRGGAFAGVCGSVKPPCAENRAGPERAESKQRISTYSSAVILGK